MALYINITTDANLHETTLIEKGGTRSGDVRKITICNNDSLPAQNVALFIEDEASVKNYIINNVDIPVGATLVLEDNLSFDKRRNRMKMITNKDSGNGPPNITVTIK